MLGGVGDRVDKAFWFVKHVPCFWGLARADYVYGV
jgi:hypothetical protein